MDAGVEAERRDYFRRRVHQETNAALRSPHPKAAAAHVELAHYYLRALSRTDKTP